MKHILEVITEEMENLDQEKKDILQSMLHVGWQWGRHETTTTLAKRQLIKLIKEYGDA